MVVYNIPKFNAESPFNVIVHSTGPLPKEVEAEERMKEIVSRSRLVEVAKSQAQEIAILRAEVERLRMKTFPALVQVENI